VNPMMARSKHVGSMKPTSRVIIIAAGFRLTAERTCGSQRLIADRLRC
jgi:hypothetical protein